jgi:hypothetical protein
MGDQPCSKAATYTGKHTQNKRKQTYMTIVGFEPTIPVFYVAKAFRALDSATTVIGTASLKTQTKNILSLNISRIKKVFR